MVNDHQGLSQYKYGKDSYTALDIVKMINRAQDTNKTGMKNCVNQYILSRVLERGGMPLVAKKIERVANTNYQLLEYNFLKRKETHMENKYQRQLESATLLGGRLKHSLYKRIKLSDTASLVESLFNETFGENNYPVEEAQDMSTHITLVDPYGLSDEECKKVANNFKRLMWDKPLIKDEPVKTR